MSILSDFSRNTANIRSITADGYDSLAELALDLRWSWDSSKDVVWRELDSELWELTHNPWVVLQTVSRDQIERKLADPIFRDNVDSLVRTRRQSNVATGWFQQNHSNTPLTCAAYFSMEFMLSEALPIYSGGLGNVAGDQLKAASDLGVPVVGVGLLYQQGYFRQVIDRGGYQQALYPYNDPGQLPIVPVRQENGEWLRLEITLPGYSLWLRAWQVQVGRLKLYLLDSNDAANYPAHRGITSELYGGGSEMRLLQEMLLGIGGWRLLVALGIQPEVCHLNEGHAAFAILERAYSFMQTANRPFQQALAITRAGNLFTTHTAVAAGFDLFAPELIEHYFTRYASQKLGIELHDLLALGRTNPNDLSESFSMANLAIRGSRKVNGVSRLHGEVSRKLFEPLFPRWPQSEIPIGYVTNGVHVPTWESAAANDLWTEACGKERWLGTENAIGTSTASFSDESIWQYRSGSRKSLVEFARERLRKQLAVSGVAAEAINSANNRFNPDALTLGFARRFASYKRPNLLLYNPQRLMRILSDTNRPVQLIMAGKAHPQDVNGQALIHQWVEFIRQHEVRPHIVFLSDYDMLLTTRLVQGVDVWINTPERPWEASGTSGMKVLVNGGINLSELDGWWAEAYSPEVGWALGDGKEHAGDPHLDEAEANALYDILEHKVIPEFYTRDENGIPRAWIQRVRSSMERLTPRFSADRAVREYTEQNYIPCAEAYKLRSSNNGAVGGSILDWRSELDKRWSGIRFGEMKTETRKDKYLFSIEIWLNDLDANAVSVELYADGREGAPFVLVMTSDHQQDGAADHLVFTADAPATRPSTDYTVRIVPRFDGVSVPHEEARILWQR
jgi:starch phosphorylase